MLYTTKKQPSKDGRKEKKMEKEMEQLIKIKRRKEELKQELIDTYCDSICDYSNGCISDIITEISDNNVDIYYYDLFEWCKHNFEYVNEWVAECGSSGDIIKDIQGGQFKQIEEELYSNINEMLLLFAYNHLYINEYILDDGQLEELEENISNVHEIDKLEDIIDLINEKLEEKGDK